MGAAKSLREHGVRVGRLDPGPTASIADVPGMSVGRVYDGAVAAAIAADPRVGVDDVVIPVVGECDDSWLNDARVVQVEADDAGRAVKAASVGFAEGAVGAGAGMVCFDW